MMVRIFSFLVLCALVVWSPWWMIGGAFLLCVVIFPWYIEGVVLLIMWDILYGVSLLTSFIVIIGAGAIVIGWHFLKRYLRFNKI